MAFQASSSMRKQLITLLLAFCIGASAMGVFFFAAQMRYEQRLLNSVSKSAITPQMGEEKKALALLSTTYRLLSGRVEIFSEHNRGVWENYLLGVGGQMNTAVGGCGSFSALLIRLLEENGFAARFAQMQCDEIEACHILVEAKVNGRWVVFDPLFNLALRNERDELATFEEISDNWQWYQGQLPEEYPELYSYTGVRYTNWGKIPVVMPAVKQTLRLLIGEDVEQISLRVLLNHRPRNHMLLFLTTLCISAFALIILLRRFSRDAE